MITKYEIEIYDNSYCILKPTLFCLSSDVYDVKLYILQSDHLNNPCDFCEAIFYSLKKRDPNISTVFVDLRNYYGKFTDSWLWKCTFIKDINGDLDDITFADVLSVALTPIENELLKEYLYENTIYDEVLVCV